MKSIQNLKSISLINLHNLTQAEKQKVFAENSILQTCQVDSDTVFVTIYIT